MCIQLMKRLQASNPAGLAATTRPQQLHRGMATEGTRSNRKPLARWRKLVPLLLVASLGALLINPPALAEFESLPPGWYVEKVFTPQLQAPNHVAVSPSGVIAITDWGVSDRVFQLHEDGSLSTIASLGPPGSMHFGIVYDSANNLYASAGNGVLWRVTPEGIATEFANGVLGFQMDIAPNEDIFAVGGDGTAIQRITSDGQVSVYAEGLTGPCDIAVNPLTGDVYVLDFGAGALSRAKPDGTLTLLASDLIPEWSYIACSPDGELYYWAHVGNLYLVSTLDGTRTEVSWVKDSLANLHATDFAFDDLGRIVAVDITYNHVVRLDLEEQTGEALWIGMGNTHGLAVAPDGGGLHMAFGHPFSDGCGGVERIRENGTTTRVVDDLGPDVCGLAFDSSGTGYVISTSPIAGEWRSTVHGFSPSGAKTALAVLPHHGYSLAVNPLTGDLWGLSYSEIWHFDSAWDRHVISTASVGDCVESLAFTPDGTLYVAIMTSDMLSIPVEAGLYRVDPAGPTFTLVADLSTVNMCCPMGRIGAGQDGNIYWVGHSDRYTPNNEHDMHMLRITPSGEVTLFGQQLPMDPSAVVGDPDSTDLYVASGCGVYRVFSSSPAVFKVEAWSGNTLADGTFYAAGFETGEADIAEWVAISEPVEPGDVLELDPTALATYRLSQTACSSLVAGVVSTRPGVALGAPPTAPHSLLATYHSQALLALTGIVPVKVTGEGGPIMPGNLLVTSSTPGHAMRWAGPGPCPCALVGKALEPMADTQGIILVLLTAH